MPGTRKVWETLPITVNKDLRTEFQFLFMPVSTETECHKRVCPGAGVAKRSEGLL